MGSTKTKSSSSTKREPWQPAQGNLRNVLTQSSAIASDPSNFTPQYSNTYNQSLDRMEGIANGQSASNEFMRPLVEQSSQNFSGGSDYLNGVMNGDPASNPYLDRMIALQQENTANAVNGQFSAAGRYGSGAHTGSLTKQLGNQELGLRYQDYGAQQGRMDNAANTLFNQGYSGTQLAPSLDQAELQQAGLLQSVGQARNEQLNAANQGDVRATEWLSQMTNPIAAQGGVADSNSTQSTPRNVPGMIMGGLTAGAGLMSGPMGAMTGLGMSSGGLMGSPSSWQANVMPNRPLYGPGF